MTAGSICPVCEQARQSREPQCPSCGWALESGYVLGRLTPEEQAADQERLEWARHRWQKRQQREAAQRELEDVQATLAHLQHRRETPQQDLTVASSEPTGTPLQTHPPSTAPPPSQGATVRRYPLSPWSPLYWGRLLCWAFFRSPAASEATTQSAAGTGDPAGNSRRHG